VRSAIEDHRCSLEGEDDPLLRQIADEINQTQETVDQLHEVLLNTDSEQMTGPTEEVGSKATMSSHKSLNDAMSEEMWLVSRRLLATHPTAQSVDELAESRELSATEVRHALIDLEDRGEVRSSRIDGVTQYTAVTDTVE
jgi:predicted Rossmann fold nucleotide-binding protein DprA/Smf involved in DNA uptake